MIFTGFVCIGHISADSAENRRRAGNPFFFRMGERVMESQHVFGNLFFKDFPAEGFKFSIFRPDMAGKISDPHTGEKNKEQ